MLNSLQRFKTKRSGVVRVWPLGADKHTVIGCVRDLPPTLCDLPERTLAA